MSFTNEELLFASLIRDRMLKMRIARTMNMSDEEAEAFRKLPVDDLVRDTMEELDMIAKVIRKVQKEKAAQQQT